MTDSTPKDLIKLYKDMADHTLPECKHSCRVPLSCCSPEYCEFTMDFASKRGVELSPTGNPRLPLMGPSGCIAPPHLRPMCTFHTCDILAVGYKKPPDDGSPGLEAHQWTMKYFDLRSEIEKGEMALQGIIIDL